MEKKIDHRFDDVMQKDLEKAQKALNDLCKSYGLKPWNIKSGKARWKELCLRMVGLAAHNAKKPGRPGHTPEFISEVGYAVLLYNDFKDLNNLDENGNIIEAQPASNKEIDKAVIKEFQIEEKEHPSGRVSHPKNILKGIKDRFSEQNKKYKAEYDPADYPENP